MEVQQTPYAILCVTSMGGHLSWFEGNGGRWHARPVRTSSISYMRRNTDSKQAANFLNRMAFEVDIESPATAGRKEKSKPDAEKTTFEPVRRKWQLPIFQSDD